MKRQATWGLALALAVLCLAFSGCKKPSAEVRIRTLEVNEVQNQDSLYLAIDFPEGGRGPLRKAVEEFISETLGGTYEGDYAQADSMLAFYKEQYFRDMMEVRGEFLDDVPMEFFKEVLISKVYETDKVVTYQVTTDEYYGGAHGIATTSGTTFRKSDGRRVGLDMLRDQELHEFLKEGLMDYFGVKTERELEDNLMGVDDLYLLPMPETEPYFMDGGMVLIYQSYEIACYAAGQPTVVIPYDKLEPLFNVTGRRLFIDK